MGSILGESLERRWLQEPRWESKPYAYFSTEWTQRQDRTSTAPKGAPPSSGLCLLHPESRASRGHHGPSLGGPACQSSEPACRPGRQQRCWGPRLHLLSQSTGRGRPTWPLLGHRRGVGTQVALPWTQVLGGPCGPTLGGSWTALPWTQVGGGNSGGPALDTGRVLGDGSRTALARLSEHRRVSWESHGRFMNQVSAHACVLKTWEDGD